MIGGLAIMLLGVGIVNYVTDSVIASFIDIIPMCLGLWFIVKQLGFNDILGHNYVKSFFVIIVSITVLLLLYSIAFVFSKDGYFFTLVNTGILNEHSWAHENIIAISEMPIDSVLFGGLESLNLGKYEVSFAYTSLMFRFGGNVLTHICIWRAFHLALVSLVMVLISVKLGIRDSAHLFFILIGCLLMPMMDTIFAYNHDGVGYAFLAIGTYIFVSCSKNSISGLIAFPFYVLLFYWFRRPYAIIAILLFLSSLVFVKRRVFDLVIGVIATLSLIVYFFMTVDINKLLVDEMEVVAYSAADERLGRGFINALLVSVLGYFPWMNLLRDINWPYAIFSCFQGSFNLAVFYYLLKSNYKKMSVLFTDSLFWAGLMFFVAAMAVPGHLSYTSVAILLFLLNINNVTHKQFFKSYLLMIFLVFTSGVVYGLLI